MSRFLGVVALYIAMFVGWTGVGAFLLFAPVRAGNLIHDSFGLFPEVRPNDRGKKVVLRIAGLALWAFAVRFALDIASSVGHD
jgi:hypothetical protein